MRVEVILLVLSTCAALSSAVISTRSRLWGLRTAAAATTLAALLPLLNLPEMPGSGIAYAAEPSGAAALIWKSGKNPTPSDPNDPKKGTKKDSSFLRCLSGCKQDCQKPGEGAAKLDCVQDCQDQCCSTYEQCSFKVKQTSSEM